MRILFLLLLTASFLSLSFMTLSDLKIADELYDRIHNLNYKTFVRAPGFETRQRALQTQEDEEEMWVDIYINDVMVKALESEKNIEEWPVGSLLVKETYIDGKFVSLGANEKREDGWVINQWNADGIAEVANRPKVCWNCHQAGDDMVLGFRFPQYQIQKKVLKH